MRSFAFAAVLGFAAAVEIETEFMDNSWMNQMSDKSHWSSVADEWDFSAMKGGHHHHDNGHSSDHGHGGHYGHYGHWGYGHGHESSEHDHDDGNEHDHTHEENEQSHTHEEQESHPNPWEQDYTAPWENQGDHPNPWETEHVNPWENQESHETHEHPDWSHYNGGHGHDPAEHTEEQNGDGHSHHWGTHTHEGDDDHYSNPWENHDYYDYGQHHEHEEDPEHEEEPEPEHEDEHDHHAPWDYWNGHKHEDDHAHDVHPHDDEAEHFDMGELAYMIKALEADIAQLEKGQLVEDVFMTNFETPLSMALDTPFTLIDPWCVAAYQTIDFAVQATFDNIADTTLGFALLKDGKPVAVARQADADSPSSLSLLYRETLHEQASFELAIKSDPPLESQMVTVAANNIQVGLRIYDEGYVGTVQSMPANNCHAHGHYGKHDD